MLVDYRSEGRIAVITLNRPEALNAINDDMDKELDRIILDFRDNPELWVAIICGVGKSFCAGADIKQRGAGILGRQTGLDDVGAEMILMGQPKDAQEAYRIGLVNKVVPPDKLMTTAME